MSQQASVEPMQIDVPPEDNDLPLLVPTLVLTPAIDLDQLASNYTGLARLYRLLHVADLCPPLRSEALRHALTYVMKTPNTQMYQIVHKKMTDMLTQPNDGIENNRLPDAVSSSAFSGSLIPAFDSLWVESTTKKAATKLEKLDTDLKNYKTNSIKESIRRGHDDLGDHYLECGDLSQALKCYSRARDYCTSSKHVVTMCLHVIKVCIYLQNWSHVLSYVNKAESTPNFHDNLKDSTISKLKISAGLAELALGKYKNSAKLFLNANYDHVDFPDLLSSNSVGIYGSLCSLATFDRQELQKNLISSSTFKLFLELEPQMREIINDFYDSKYAKCLTALDKLKDSFYLDLYLCNHVDNLYSQIRNKALCQYFSPYKSIDLNKMVTAFNTDLPGLEEELMKLILEEKINARIDSHNKVLYAKDVNQRTATFEKSFELGEEVQRKTKALILRAAVIKSQLQVKSPNTGGQQTDVTANRTIKSYAV